MRASWLVLVGFMAVCVGCSTPAGCDSTDGSLGEGAVDGQPEGEAQESEEAQGGEESQKQPALKAIDDGEVDEPEGAKEEALGWMRAGPGAVVVKLHLDAAEEQIAPVFEPVVLGVGGAMGAEFVEQFIRQGPLMVFDPPTRDGEPVIQFDGERAAYISRQPIAWDTSYFDALIYGAVLQPDLVGPAGGHYRMLLPTDDPQQVAESLEEYVDDELPVGVAITPGEHYLRVDVVKSVEGAVDAREVDEHFGTPREERWEKLLEQAASRRGDASLRQTPALATFVSSTAPVGVYFRSEDLRVMQALDFVTQAMDLLPMAAPENRQLVLTRAVAGALHTLAFAPTSEFDHEDTVLELRAPGARGLVVDAASTQTEHGRVIAAHIGEATKLDDVPKMEDPAVELRWNFDASAAAEQIPPSLNQMAEVPEGRMHMMPLLAEYYREGGILGLLSTIFINPSSLPRWLAYGEDVISPRRGHLVVGVGEPEREGAPFGFAGVGIFNNEDLEQKPPQILAGLMARLEHDGMDVELARFSEDPSRIDMTAGAMVTSQETEQVQFDAAPLVVMADLSRFGGEFWGGDEFFEALGDMARLNVEWGVDGAMTRQRYTMGDVQLEWPELVEIDGFDAMEPRVRCTGGLADEAMEIFLGLEQMAPGTPVDVMVETLLDDYDELAEDCASDDPHLAEHLDEVRARMRFILFFRATHEQVPTLYDAICDAGDSKMCKNR